MKVIVQKYGGTSMGSVDRIHRVATRIKKWSDTDVKLVVVTSAMSGETNRLISLAKNFTADPDARSLDQVLASGEQVSSGLLTIMLKELGLDAISFCGWQVKIVTDSVFGKAKIKSIDPSFVRKELSTRNVVVITGFQGIDESSGAITTLGRGGSDTSAVALAYALKAEECLIYTDVDGVYTTDPRVEPNAKRLKTVTFEEMLEMSSLGSKVLQIRAVGFAGKFKVKTRVLSSFQDPNLSIADELRESTIVTHEEDEVMEEAVISGIAFNRDEARITVSGVSDTPGVAHKILGPIANANIDVDMIIQNSSRDGTTDFSFTVHKDELRDAEKVLLDEVPKSLGYGEICSDINICKVSVVGIGMRSNVGVASKMFEILSMEGINIKMISTSEIKISVVIDDKYMELAVRALHRAFNLDV
ncbi:MAG: aspartate kinase [Betaproteobacteria bacterium TMED82]|nr:MAG: aspartate kinase [Betaproteobacteria bacterium TMED82]|tara:strand:- start:46810 stop:48060 length:1251 start_codon:yes stop_codon:yes gene_type:complete